MTEPTDTIGEDVRLYRGDALAVLPTLPSASVDAVVTDPPYPEIDRPYGRLTERQWFDLMDWVVVECRRVLKPTGSAVFVIQPNSERFGKMRTWWLRFMLKWAEEWGMVQDAYWWNYTAMPGDYQGLMRPSVKPCVWLGPPDCYRDQDAVLWKESEGNALMRRVDRGRRDAPSGRSVNNFKAGSAALVRGGVVPFNLLPHQGCQRWDYGGGAHGHGASTPFSLCDWWVRYICPPGGTVLEPFMGSGTVGLACKDRGFVGIERDPGYYATAVRRLKAASGVGVDQLFGCVPEVPA
jgi:hypothetical protein